MNYPNEIMLLMNDIDGDFLDGGHIKRFHILLAEHFNDSINYSQHVDSENVVELYYLYLISSFIDEGFLDNRSIDDMMDLINSSEDQICVDPNDYVMTRIANEIYYTSQVGTGIEELIDDDFSKILMNIKLMDTDFDQSINKMGNLLSVVQESIEQGLLNSKVNFDFYNDLSR